MHPLLSLLSRRLVAIAAASLAQIVHADAPLRTDNADVPAKGNCKVEAWYEDSRSSRDFVISPSCVPFGVVEWGASYGRAHAVGDGDANAFSLQAKIPLVAKTRDAIFALATTLLVARDTSAPHGDSSFQVGWINVPASLYLQDDRLRLHANAGALWHYAKPNVFTWGFATEYDVDRVTWLAEAYHLETARPRLNVGARYAVLDEGFDVYASAGRRFGSDPDGWFFVVGIKLESPTFLK